MTREMFEEALLGMANQVSGEQVLQDIANQLRMNRVRQLPGTPVVTPLDVFKAYRDQNERVAVKAASFPVANFIAAVPEPPAAQVEAYYAKYKDVLPDPAARHTRLQDPAPDQGRDPLDRRRRPAREIQDKLTEAELRSYYENRKAEFIRPTGLPDDIFAGDPKAELTPPQPQPFEEVRPYLATSLAEEKAQAEIVNRFTKIKDEVMIPFADAYHDALDEINEAKKIGREDDGRAAQAQGPQVGRRGGGAEPRDHAALDPRAGRELRPDLRRRGGPDPAQRRPQVRRRDVRPEDEAVRAGRADRRH